MARTGQLHRLHRGVFAVGHDALLPFARETAALLAVGEGAYLSHLSAARLWQIVPGEAQEVDVLRHPGRAHARPGIRLHEASHLEPRDTRTHEHLPVTSPARTVLDLADSLTGRPLEKAIAEAWALKLITNTSLRDILARANGHRGAATLAALAGLARHTRSRSVSEDHLLRLLRQAELPLPIMNAPLYGWNVDYYWPEHGLVLELDSYQFHSSRWAFDRDRRKSAALTARGLRVMHSTSEQVDETPFVVVGRIAQALAHARAA
jgi:very-short-patch-repair endonuclease